MSRPAATGSDTDRIDEDGGAVQAVGDEPIHHRERQSGAAGGKGVEGVEPLARCAMWHIAWAGSSPITNFTRCFRVVSFFFVDCMASDLVSDFGSQRADPFLS